MVFSSIVFLLYFLPVFLLVEALAGAASRGTWLRNLVTLAFSIFFYAWGAPQLVFVVVGTTLLDFYLVQAMHGARTSARRRLLLGLTIVVNIGLLFYFKYANFFLENLSGILELMGGNALQWTKVLLPIGISFFTFQKITYAMDVYRGVHEPLRSPFDHLMYILMFPQLIAGPIVRFHTIADQLSQRHANEDDRLTGFFRFCIGLAKKVLIANVLGAQADEIFQLEAGALDSTLAWVGILAYTFQIYFDFAGYSDMAIGIGRMIGFRFPENFDNPYTSGSISEFWRRWHITLGAWMRDYLYIPLGGNRVRSRVRLYLNLWVVFLLSGLWHGASWNFVLWGAWHGAFLVLDRLFLLRVLNQLPKLLRVGFTFGVVVMGWVLFRVETLGGAWAYYRSLFAFDFGHFGLAVHREFLTILGLAVLFSFVTLTGPGRKVQDALYRERYALPATTGLLLMSLALFVLCLASITAFGFNPFIYFRFLMAARSHIAKRLYLLLLLGLLFVPMLQGEFQWWTERPLKGAVKETPAPDWSWEGWWQDSSQVQTERYLNDHFGFRRSLVRGNNQLAYWLYRTAKANGVVVGKQGWLYEEGYLTTLYGADYRGADRNRELATGLREIQDMLARYGKLLVVVMAPGKGYQAPEYIPDRYRKPGEHATNYQDFARFLPEEDILHIDANAWFRAMRDTSRYPLYPKTGIHWSVYGKWLLVDSLAALIEQRTGKDLPDLVWKDIEVDPQPRDEDRDIERGMNLLYPIPNQPMAYPQVHIERQGKYLMRNLTIADSYWWGIFGKGIAGRLFAEPEFWYYNSVIHGAPERKGILVHELDMAPVIAEQDLVIIVCTDAKLKDFGWRFVDRIRADSTFEERLRDATLELKVADIRKDENWLAAVRQQAAEREISVDSMLVLSAAYALHTRLPEK